MGDLMDIVVPVREGAANAQLRYALRSWAANLPHRRVWLAGYLPGWAREVGHIPTRQTGTKYQNTTKAVRAACEHPGVTDTFLLCNDDFFVMTPQPDRFPVYHRGPVRDVEAYYATRGSGKYLRGLRETRDLLVSLGHEDPLSYELHVPLPVSKSGMLKTLQVGRRLDVLHKRTAYGVLNQLGGERMADVKILHRAPRGYTTASPLLSTMPDSFTNGAVGKHIRATFPRACRYEGRVR
ncbi:hypothetical protein SJI45_19125 [Streptomyces sp. S399]|uniref:hypothetical protein n=1 Tax=Streptomyces sp. S399 TaxID=3096009 RepID=UPI002A800460|nr:hypothetical protein [Streptomyces sp. S399]WPR52850.1 hypothetical protein SJI45_19125 [Streptomyces sp. S399]